MTSLKGSVSRDVRVKILGFVNPNFLFFKSFAPRWMCSPITQEGLTGQLRPLKVCPTLLLYFTVNFGLIDEKQTQQESSVSQLSTEKNRSIYL